MTEYTFINDFGESGHVLGFCETDTDTVNLNMEGLVTSCMLECGPVQKDIPDTEAFERVFIEACIQTIIHEHIHLALMVAGEAACHAFDKICEAV